MRILGVMDSHLSSAALVEDGVLVAAVREEVATRQKGAAGFPRAALQAVLALAEVDGAAVDAVAFGIRADRFDTPRYQAGETGWKRNGVATAVMALPRGLVRSEGVRRAWVGLVGAARARDTLKTHGAWLAGLGLPVDHISFREHHDCHAATALYLDPAAGEDRLVFVCDGYGDGGAGGVWVARGGRRGPAEVRRIQRVGFADSLGSIYSRVTRVLGLKPWEHEHKVMGLAPYGASARAERLLAALGGLYGVEGGRLVNHSRRTGIHLEGALERLVRGYRFDEVAWAVQALTERCLTAWVRHHVRETGIHRVALAGGVFLNVKANQAIAALPEVEGVFIVPPAGDDSASVGAALDLWAEGIGAVRALGEARPLGGLDLGLVGDGDVPGALVEHRGAGWKIRRSDDIDGEVARLLAEGQIVARCTGRGELGPRALGHRSILCPAHDLGRARELNQHIKARDFWMPFAATVLDTFADRYLVNPKGIDAPYMILTFPTTAEGQEALAAALHPADGTTRPQVLTEAADPRFYTLLRRYADLTGRGALLNTSFNRHGEPMVGTAEDALRTFAGSGLRHLALGAWLIQKG